MEMEKRQYTCIYDVYTRTRPDVQWCGRPRSLVKAALTGPEREKRFVDTSPSAASNSSFSSIFRQVGGPRSKTRKIRRQTPTATAPRMTVGPQRPQECRKCSPFSRKSVFVIKYFWLKFGLQISTLVAPTRQKYFDLCGLQETEIWCSTAKT